MNQECAFEELENYFCNTIQTSASTRGRENELTERLQMLLKEHLSYGVLQRFFAYTNFLNYSAINRGVFGDMLCPRLPILEESLIRDMIEEGGAKLYYGNSVAKLSEDYFSLRAHATIRTRSLTFHVDAISKDLPSSNVTQSLEISLERSHEKDFGPYLHSLLTKHHVSDDDIGNIAVRVSALGLLCQPMESLAPDKIFFRINLLQKSRPVFLHCVREQVLVEDTLGTAPCVLKWRISYND